MSSKSTNFQFGQRQRAQVRTRGSIRVFLAGDGLKRLSTWTRVQGDAPGSAGNRPCASNLLQLRHARHFLLRVEPGASHRGAQGQMVVFCVELKRFGDAHAPSVLVLSLREVDTKINVILSVEKESKARANGGQEVVAVKLSQAGRHFTDATECYQAEPLRQGETVFQLSSEHPGV